MPDQISKGDFVIGVDLGGTKILAGVFDSQMECVARAKCSTKPERGPSGVIERIVRCIKDAVDEADLDIKRIKAIGLGAPGSVDSEEGRVIFAPNLSWEDVPLKKQIQREFDVPVRIENDCNACTLAVHAVELKDKPRQMVGIFLGTGIGAGLIVNGKLLTGHNYAAGEIGHMVLQVGGPKCSCGNRGCFEALASRVAIFRNIQERIKKGEKTLLTEMLGPDLEGMRSGDLRKAVKRGDKLAEKVIEEAAEYTGIAIANVINFINPEIIVLGGGVIEQLEDEMMAIITETAVDYAMPDAAKGVAIIASKLADDAGIIGGCVLARRLLASAS